MFGHCKTLSKLDEGIFSRAGTGLACLKGFSIDVQFTPSRVSYNRAAKLIWTSRFAIYTKPSVLQQSCEVYLDQLTDYCVLAQ